MHSISHINSASPSRAEELFSQQWHDNARRTDRMFAVLMVLQWAAAIIVSLLLSPKTWNGSQSHIHPHVWLSLFLGGTLTSLPVALAWKRPGRRLTRHVIAIAQMMFSSLLIHVSGGRIETHFHVFGSLAFLAFYRDWTVLIPATLFVAGDHFVRGTFWPQTVFGITTADPWRWVEHAAWVIYEDVFLIASCHHGVAEMWSSARRTAELERINREMQQKTTQLETAFRSRNAIVETALDAVVGMDSAGRITGWNSQAEATFGWKADEVIGRVLAEIIIPPRYQEAHTSAVKRYLESGESHVLNRRIEVSSLRRDGHEFPVELSVSPIRSDESIGFCAFIRDITLRSQAAEAMRAAKEAAESASQAKSDFLANMSHEIRTPLNGILGFTDLLLNDVDGAVEERRDHLQTIHDSGRHLLSLINDVLDLSKVESGQMGVEQVRCSPHEIIAATVSVLRVKAQQRGLHLEYFWKGPFPQWMHSDPARLRQILMNLIGNAIKFTEVGSVQVAGRFQPGDSPRIVIDVIDTGVGIDPAALKRIFDPFMQADTSITRRFGGTGLGLSISRRLVQLLGGDLTVNSEPGRGSIFSVALPTGPLEGVPMTIGSPSEIVTRQPAFAGRPARSLPACRVLAVDDGITNRKLINVVLKQAGADVCCAENGQEAVAAASSEAFDVILMDMQMPVLDGYSATRELRRLGVTVPIVALTAHAMPGDEQKCREAGCSGYLAKPFDPAKLLKVVAEALCDRGGEKCREGLASQAGEAILCALPIDDPEFREIVEEFVLRLEEQLAAVREAWRNGDRQTIGQIAHWIKGAGGTAGFGALTEPSASLEKLANHGTSEQIGWQIGQLEELCRRIQLPAGNLP